MAKRRYRARIRKFAPPGHIAQRGGIRRRRASRRALRANFRQGLLRRKYDQPKNGRVKSRSHRALPRFRAV